MKTPWRTGFLVDWNIGAMNHYFIHNERHLYVLMTKGNLFIKAEGRTEYEVWDELQSKAKAMNGREG